MPPTNRKPIIAAVLGVGIIIVIIIVAVSIRPPAKSPTTASSSPAPGVSAAPSEPNYSGTEFFTNYGLSDNQFADLKFALHRFFTSVNLAPKQISFDNVIHSHDSTADLTTMSFNLTTESDIPYQGRIQYTDLDTIDLVISQNGQQLFDSGPVNLAAGGSPAPNAN